MTPPPPLFFHRNPVSDGSDVADGCYEPSWCLVNTTGLLCLASELDRTLYRIVASTRHRALPYPVMLAGLNPPGAASPGSSYYTSVLYTPVW
jgi:hypothetical protein